ncbi:neurogenic locus Notch protein-like isoform X2 [Ylistrum balloti]|uniref:neurogenic locus Notch protein-like isoform X2 n=1 Tax=Ylistrum balloti TaxID=509963 RepID=UPI002905C730|nr:neurogenic locus Notch protein-like isoform X2 [Ylistrum balloti]
MEPWIVLLVLISVLKLVSGTAQVQIRLVRYINPGGKGDNGHPCDGRWLFNGSPCDHRIVLCMDTVSGSDSVNRCAYGRADTGEISNADTITFAGRAGRLSNPFTFRVALWPGSVRIKVRVFDVDDNSDDFVDFMQKVFTTTVSANSRSHRVLVKRRTTLLMDVRVFCDPHYFGQQCTVFCRPRNDWMGHFTCDQTTGAKVCNQGWRGRNCNRKIDICAPCQHGSCDQSAAAYKCVCDLGFTGTNCEINMDECASDPCRNGGLCLDLVGQYTCICSVGWNGPDCENDVNECLQNTCRNNGTCINEPGSYRCKCDEGWNGKHCDIDVDECALGSQCNTNASCINVPGTFECACSEGLTGWSCEDINECVEDNPCFGNSTCINQHGSFQCFCPEGWTGDLCDVDIDECVYNPCLFNSTCMNRVGSFVCMCTTGVAGMYCEIDINECATSPCYGNSTCINQAGSFTCSCADGFLGSLCETDIDECASTPCANNGSCVDQVGGFSCECLSGWTGDQCEEEQDECAENTDPVMVNIHGKLDTSGVEILNHSIAEALSQLFMINRDDIRLLLTSELWTDADNKPMTTVLISAYVQDSQICRDELTNIFSTENILDNALETPATIVYQKSVSDGQASNLQGTTVMETKENWLLSRWYILAVIAGVFIALVAIAIVIFKHKRRPKALVIAGRNDSLYRNGSLTMPEDTGDETSVIASLSFDNVLYTTFQPQGQAPPLDPQDNENVRS